MIFLFTITSGFFSPEILSDDRATSAGRYVVTISMDWTLCCGKSNLDFFYIYSFVTFKSNLIWPDVKKIIPPSVF